MDKKRITMKKKIKFKKKRNISYKPLNFYKQKMMKGGMSEDEKKELIKCIEECKKVIDEYNNNITTIDTLFETDITNPDSNHDYIKQIIDSLSDITKLQIFQDLQNKLSGLTDYDKSNISVEMNRMIINITS